MNFLLEGYCAKQGRHSRRARRGTFNKLLCEETTNDPNFTFGELSYVPGGVRGPLRGHEAFHCLRDGESYGSGPEVTMRSPLAYRGAGQRVHVEAMSPARWKIRATAPLWDWLLCHVDRPCHAHAFSHSPGEGNFLHYHGVDKWVEPLHPGVCRSHVSD